MNSSVVIKLPERDYEAVLEPLFCCDICRDSVPELLVSVSTDEHFPSARMRCKKCHSERIVPAFRCGRCNHIAPASEMLVDEDFTPSFICRDCYSICSHCGEPVSTQFIFSDDNGEPICYDCTDFKGEYSRLFADW